MSTLGVYAFPLFCFCHSSAFGYGGRQFAFYAKPHEIGFSSLEDRWPSCDQERALPGWLLASLETQPCPGAAPGHISDPMTSRSGGPHWQPQVLTASVSWCEVPLADKAGQHAAPCHFCVMEETKALDICDTIKWLLWSFEYRLSSLCFAGGLGLGKGALALSDRTRYLMGNSALTLCISVHQEQISQAFFFEIRLVIRVNIWYRGSITMEKK